MGLSGQHTSMVAFREDKVNIDWRQFGGSNRGVHNPIQLEPKI
jgi:hypothetical protein